MDQPKSREAKDSFEKESETQESPLILIVDDEPLALELSAMALQRKGFRTVTARGGLEGWERVQDSKPELVLLDITMPDIDGFEVFRRIRSLPGSENLPVLFVSARNDLEHKVKGLDLGAVDYITKPYNPNELVARVRNTLRLQKLEKDARAKENEEVRRRIVETLLVTVSHYINNAMAAILGRVEITPSDNEEMVEQMKNVVRRQGRVVTATIEAIEGMLDELQLETKQYASSDVDMLNIDERLATLLVEKKLRDRRQEE